MKVNQLLKPNVVDTNVFSQLPPKHKEVVNDFFNQVDYDNAPIDRFIGQVKDSDENEG